MTEAIFVRRLELCGGDAKSRQKEQWVVTEAAVPSRRECDLAMPAPIRDQRLRIVGRANGDQHAGVVRAPWLDAGELAQKLRVVGLIIRHVTREARRAYAGRVT